MNVYVAILGLLLGSSSTPAKALDTSSLTDTSTTTNTATSTATSTQTTTQTSTQTSTTTSTAPDAARASEELLHELLLVAPHFGLKDGKMTCQLATALSALQYNIKENDVKRVALMEGWGCTYRSAVPVGAAFYLGFGLSVDHPNAAQGSILFSVIDWIAIGPGLQVFKNYDGKYTEQWLLTLALNLNVGISLDTLLTLIDSLTGKASAIAK